jgi:hypothetical protein
MRGSKLVFAHKMSGHQSLIRKSALYTHQIRCFEELRYNVSRLLGPFTHTSWPLPTRVAPRSTLYSFMRLGLPLHQFYDASVRFQMMSLFCSFFGVVCSMRSMRSMRGGIIFRNRGPSLKVHHGQCPTRMTKHDSGGSPPGAACDSAKPPHGKTQGSV